MKFRTIVLSTIATVLLAGCGVVALPPAAADEAPALNCESWEVPGWLGEDGLPTGCVDNAPCPEVREGLPCPADVVTPPPVVEAPKPVPVPHARAPMPVAPPTKNVLHNAKTDGFDHQP